MEKKTSSSEAKSAPLSGRRAEAARNDGRILEAAREVFVADPGAPISAVAGRAGVGIGALYRRYASKEELLQRLALDGLRRYAAAVEAALNDEGDPWDAFAGFMRLALEAGAGSLAPLLAGSFAATDELEREAREANDAARRLLERAKAAGALRADIEVGDVSLLLEQLQTVRVADSDRARELRLRYLALVLDSLRAPGAAPLPGSPPGWEEIRQRWET